MAPSLRQQQKIAADRAAEARARLEAARINEQLMYQLQLEQAYNANMQR